MLERPVNAISKLIKQSRRVFSNRFVAVIFLLLVLVVGLLLVLVIRLSSVIDAERQQAIDEFTMVSKPNSTLPGVACTIITDEYARKMIGEDIERSVNTFTYPVFIGESNEVIDWVRNDSCSYYSPSDSSHYIETYISYFGSSETASDELEKRLPDVNEIQELDAKEIGASRFLYDAGVHYVLYDTHLLIVSAGNGSQKSQKQFSRTVLDRLISELPPLYL